MKTPFSKLLMAVSWERVAAGILGVALLVSLSVDYDPDTGVTMTTVSTTALVVAAVMCLVGVGIVGVEALWQDWTETATARGPLAISVIGGLGLVFCYVGLIIGSAFPSPFSGAILPIGLALLWYAQVLFRKTSLNLDLPGSR